MIWGRVYYDSLRVVYAKPNDAHEALKPQGVDGLEVGQTIMKCMLAAQREQRPDRAPFMNYFASAAEPPNKVELAGIWRWLITLRVACQKQLVVSVDALAWIQRLQLHVKFADSFVHITPWVVGVLVTLLDKARVEKQSDEDWIACRRSMVEMVLDSKDLDAALKAGVNVSSVETQLTNLCLANSLGRTLFESKVSEVMASKVAKHIEAAVVDVLSKEEPLTLAVLTDAQTKTIRELEAMQGIDTLPARRSISCWYRGVNFKLEILTLADEVETRFACGWKGQAVHGGSPAPLWIEELLVSGDDKALYKIAIDKSVVSAAATARSTLQKAVEAKSVKSADVLQKLVGMKSANMLLLDKTFKIEIQLITDVTRADGDSKLQTEVMKMLPSTEAWCSAEACAQRLQRLSAGDLMKLSARSAQEKLKMVQNLVQGIVEGRMPQVRTANTNDWSKEVLVRLALFLRVEVGAKKFVYGAEACVKLLERLQASHKGKKAKMEEVTPIKTFGWLLSESQMATVDGIAKELANTSGGAKKVIGKSKDSSVPGSSASSSGGAKSGDKQKAEDLSFQKAYDMFK